MMLKSSSFLSRWRVLLFAGLFLAACISNPYDESAVQNTNNLRTRTTELMNRGVEPYTQHSAAIDVLLTDLKKTQDQAAANPKNAEVAKSWEALNNEVVGPYFAKWQRDGMLNPVFITQSVQITESSFNAILRAEEAKPKK